MKILLVSFYFFPELGAAPSRITNMAEGFRRQDVNVDVLTCLPNYPKGKIFENYSGCLYKRERINECNIYRYWTYATVSKNPVRRGISMVSFAVIMWLFAFKVKLIRTYDCVIIQSPPLPVAASAICLFKRLFKKKTILNVSDLWPLSAVELGAIKTGSKIHRIFSKLEKYNYKNADAVFGQSNEILNYIAKYPSSGKRFLYRNLQKHDISIAYREKNEQLKIVYAGLFGVAQDILGIIKNVDFKSLGVEFHLYGGGNQAKEIESFIAENDCNVFYHGYVAKEDIASELEKYDASVIPLTVRIEGAVPSKIFDLFPLGIPVLFCGGGEGASIVKEYNVGFISTPDDYAALINNIKKLKGMTDNEYKVLSQNCIQTSRTDFNFDRQMQECYSFVCNLIK